MVFLESKFKTVEWAPFVLRLIIGIGFIVHGLAKLNRGPDKFARVLTWMDVPFPHFTAWLVTLIEIFGGFAMLIGAFVTLISIPLLAIHVVAMFGVHMKFGFSSVNTVGLTPDGPLFGPPGYEINLLYMAGILAIIFSDGAGIWSVDGLLNRKKSSEADHGK